MTLLPSYISTFSTSINFVSSGFNLQHSCSFSLCLVIHQSVPRSAPPRGLEHFRNVFCMCFGICICFGLYLRFFVAFVFGVCVLYLVCIISVNAAFFCCICFQGLFVFHFIICRCFLLMYAFWAVVPRLHLPATVGTLCIIR